MTASTTSITRTTRWTMSGATCPGDTPPPRTCSPGPNTPSPSPATTKKTSSPAASSSTGTTPADSAPTRLRPWSPSTPARSNPAPTHQGIQAQSLAYSLDGGYTWTKHTANPVLNRGSAEFRDPKVIRYDGDAGSYWVMVAVEATDFQVVLYKSYDLKNWEPLSTFGPANATGGVWECPDLFSLPVDGDPNNLQVGPHRQPQPRRPEQRLCGAVLRRRLRRDHVHLCHHRDRRPPGPGTVGRVPVAGLGPGLLRRSLLQRRTRQPPPDDRLDEQLGIRQPHPHLTLAQPHDPGPRNFPPHHRAVNRG